MSFHIDIPMCLCDIIYDAYVVQKNQRAESSNGSSIVKCMIIVLLELQTPAYCKPSACRANPKLQTFLSSLPTTTIFLPSSK